MGRGRPPGGQAVRRPSWRRTRVVGALLMSMVMSGTVLGAQAWAIPADGMSRGEVELPDIPDAQVSNLDGEADTGLGTAPEVPEVDYAPTQTTPWSAGTATVDLTGLNPGEYLQAGALPVELGIPEDADAAQTAALAGEWTVDLAGADTSEAAGVPGVVMDLTPPATAAATADEVAVAVDATGFADLFGPEAADRFGLALLPDCVMETPTPADCGDESGATQTLFSTMEEGTQTIQARSAASPQVVTSDSVAARAAFSPLNHVMASPRARSLLAPRLRAEDAGEPAAPTRTYRLSGTVPVAELDPETAGTGGDGTEGASTVAYQTATGSGGNVVGAIDTGASAAGDFTATPLLSAGSWAGGSSNGAFTYSYQVQTPEVPGGPTPSVVLGYSSQSVDGRTSASNNQASWIGDGWNYNAGSITRTYASCLQDAKTNPGANNDKKKTADKCWGSDNATMSLGGSTVALVKDDTTGVWTTANGDGSKIELLKDTGLANGDADGEYWRVTTRDGTRYHFGRNRLPGWSSGDPETKSVLTVPVAGNHSGEPCYATSFDDSFCTQAWRWQLDYVEDVHGNAMSLWWERETNRYAKNLKFKNPVSYDRGGYLKRIDYGQRADTLFSAEPLARVTFTVAERCFDEGSATCTDEAFTSKDPGQYRIWYDTPASLHCKADKTCWNAAPAFFTRKRLDKITTETQRVQGSTARQTVDVYQLKQTFPLLRTGANTALWLESVQRTGYAVDGSTGSLNPVRFEPNADAMPNRVIKGASDPRPGFDRLRIGRVINEYGGESVVTYSQPTGACATGTGMPAPESNDLLCYPVYWHPDPEAEEIDWFHKYVVERVEELPAVDGSYPVITDYAYGTPAWKLTQQEFSKKSRRTYSNFAGFDQTTVYTGVNDTLTDSRRSKAVTRFFRGLGDDVTITDTEGNTIAKDLEPFAGRIAEQLMYSDDGDADSDWLTRSVTIPQATKLAERERGDGLDPLRAWRVTEPTQISYAKSSGTGDDTRTERVVRTETEYESTYGLPTRIEFLGDTGKSGDESCTVMSYAHNTGAHLIGLTKEIKSAPGTCANADFADLTTLLSASRVAYDGQGYGAAPANGLATETWSLKADGSGFRPNGTKEFDSRGRVTRMTDPDGNSGTITYTPATGQAHQVTETNSLGHAQTTVVEPGRGTGLEITDANGHTSTAVYDALGRLVEAWAPGRSPASGGAADFRVAYDITPGQPPVVTTYNRGHDGAVEKSTTLYDGLGRERQSQTPAVGGGRLITDTLYNRSGEVRESRNAYFTEGGPAGDLFTPDAPVPNATRYTYDSLGRVLTETPVFHGTEDPDKAVSYAYGHDHSTVINPEGGASYRLFTDALGRTVRVDTFTDSARSEFTTTRYEFDKTGAMTKAVSADDNAWTWSFDQRGRLVSATDPDAGTTTTTYDHLDRPVTRTDARGVTVWTGYDELSRPTSQRLDSSTGDLLGTYTYDTVPGGIGLPASATRFTDGDAYTTEVGGYTDDYQPTSTTLKLPQSIADTWGLQTSYSYSYDYTDTGMLRSTQLPAVGGLDAEKLLVRYTADGLPLSVSGTDWYSSETVYSPYGQVLRSTLGGQPYRVWTTAEYDEATGELKEQRTYREKNDNTGLVPGFLASQRSYSYDAAGNVTSIREHAGSLAERQCFTYDPLGRLTEAWTSGKQDSCTADGQTGPAPSYGDGTLNVAKGADLSGYWHTYSYDALGNRTDLVDHDVDGDSAKDRTVSYTYGAADGSQPRTLTQTQSTYTTPEGAEVTEIAERLYDETGNTVSVTEHGDTQSLSWTHDGKIERVTGEGANGAVAYFGLGGKCLDLSSGITDPGRAIQLWTCNTSGAQKFTFTAERDQPNPDLGTLKVLEQCVQPASGTAGAALQIQPCDGGGDQNWERTAAGQLQHQDTGLCAKVSGGSTTNGTPVELATCDGAEGAQQWEPQGETRYIYGPGGSRLLSVQERQATLHLGDAEITTGKGGVLISTLRTYSGPGGQLTRFSYGSSASSFLIAVTTDHQGSPYAEIELYGDMKVKVRKQDPFGNVRAAAETSANLRTSAGFLGAARDDSTGYVTLGARTYDPAVGRFLSADPVLDLADPQQANGYAYAHNNPVTHSDPTGLAISLSRAEKVAAWAGAGYSAADIAQANADLNKSLTSIILSAAWEILKEFIGINDAMACFGGDMWACGSLIVGAIPWTKLWKVGKVWKAVDKTIAAIKAWRKAKAAARATLRAVRAAERAALSAKKKAAEAAKKAAQAKKARAAEKANTTSNKAVTSSKKTGNPTQKQAAGKSNRKSSTSSSSGGGGSGKGKQDSKKPGGDSGSSSRSNGGSSGSGGAGKVDEGASCPIGNSFTPETRVLMADGSTKAIEDVEVGDKVLASDPETGETRVETVTAEIRGDGAKNLVRVTIDTDGEDGDGTAEVTATDGHPFWVPELGEWIDATDLSAGQWLRTSAGTYVQVTAVERWTTHRATVHNLTVSDLHTYYVVAGAASVLVHNCGNGGNGEYTEFWEGGGGIMAELNDGALTMVIEAGAGSPRGGAMFAGVMEHFGPENVTSFQAKWVPAMPTNLNQFNENLRNGMSFNDAAAKTFTGHMLSKYGLTDVFVDQGKLVGDFGHYVNAEPVFSRPGR